MTALAAACEEQGVVAIWVAEPPGATPAGVFLVCAAIAASTRTVRIVAAAGDPSGLHPVRLAEDVATLDGLSAGRIELALDAPGPDEGARRWHGLHDQIERLVDAWGQPPSGGVDVRPKPVQRPQPPIWIRCETPDPWPSGRRSRDDTWLPSVWLHSLETGLRLAGDVPGGDPIDRFARMAFELPIAEIDRLVARIPSEAANRPLDLILPGDPARPEPAIEACIRLRRGFASARAAVAPARP